MSLELLDLEGELRSLREAFTQSKTVEVQQLMALNATLAGIKTQLTRIAGTLERMSDPQDATVTEEAVASVAAESATSFSWSQP